MLRRLPILLGLVLVLLSATGRAAGIDIVRVFPGWRSEESFRSVFEYLLGREQPFGHRIILRSQPGHRGGYYWLVRLKNRGTPLSHAQFELRVITPASPETKTFTFPVDVAAGRPIFEIGLTGADWPDSNARPVAWCIRLLADEGRTVVAQESYLWELR